MTDKVQDVSMGCDQRCSSDQKMHVSRPERAGRSGRSAEVEAILTRGDRSGSCMRVESSRSLLLTRALPNEASNHPQKSDLVVVVVSQQYEAHPHPLPLVPTRIKHDHWLLH